MGVITPLNSAQGPGRSLSAHAVTLITDESPEHAQALVWRAIADNWPAPYAPPRLHVLTLDRAATAGLESLGSAILAVVDDERDPSTIYQLIDHLWEEGMGGVLLLPNLDERRARMGGKGVVPMGRSSNPALIAATLHALIERQSTVDQLTAELRTTRRFQGGLRGQMEKIHEELELAAGVQREFLPRTLPNINGVEIHVMFRPAGYVSGDIYDVQRLDEDHIGFFIADAVGHGVPAALMTMVLTRSLVTKQVLAGDYRIIPPGEVLERLNREMVDRHGESPRFATAVYGLINTRTRHVTIAGAGHPAPLIIRGDQIDRVETQGGLLGVFADDRFDETSFTLEPGQALVLYSDGFETAFPAPGCDEYGRRVPTRHYIDHFAAMVRRWSETDMPGAFRTLATELDKQIGSLNQLDDLTVMMIAPGIERPLDKLFKGTAEESAPREAAAQAIQQPQA